MSIARENAPAVVSADVALLGRRGVWRSEFGEGEVVMARDVGLMGYPGGW